MAYYIYKDQKSEWRWRYVASNGRVIGVSSEGYINKADCQAAIALMKGSNAAPVREG